MTLFRSMKELFSVADVILAITVILVISLMVIPIPTWMLDILMVVNISIGLLTLLTAIYLNEPLDFAAFPSILLIITLFRLSINVASTKLILSLGVDFDGGVVEVSHAAHARSTDRIGCGVPWT